MRTASFISIASNRSSEAMSANKHGRNTCKTSASIDPQSQRLPSDDLQGVAAFTGNMAGRIGTSRTGTAQRTEDLGKTDKRQQPDDIPQPHDQSGQILAAGTEASSWRKDESSHSDTSLPGNARTGYFMSSTKEERDDNQIRILPVLSDKKSYLPLLLIGDEQESMIDRYLDRGEMVVMQNRTATPVAVAVVTDEGDGILELKNLAVHPRFQRKGYGRRMIAYLCEHYKNRFHTLLAGTGESRQTLSFYRNCGFSYSHTVTGFFTQNYDHPIVEDGKVLADMVYFKKLFKFICLRHREEISRDFAAFFKGG